MSSLQMTRKAQQLLGNLQIFDGIKGLLSIQFCYCFAFYCAFYQIIQFPDQAQKVKNEMSYIISIESIFESAKTVLMISGFMQIFSFLSKHENPTPIDALKYFGLRFIKIFPVYAFCLVYIIFSQDQLGSGPMWHLMDRITTPCTQNG